MVGPQRRGISRPPRSGTRARRLSARPQALRDDAGLGDGVEGNARLAESSLAEEAAALAATDKDVAIGGAGLAAAALELDLVDELRMFRYPMVVGGGTPFLPPVSANVPLSISSSGTFGSRVVFERYGRARAE
jgi:dihydrofolate reductase